MGESIPESLRSGGQGLAREISSGQQTYDTDPDLYPVNEPVGKYEGKTQCTGEAQFINDIPPTPNELHAAYVVTTVANCDLDTVDPSEALAMPGVVDYLDHNDIPGKNTVNTAVFDSTGSEQLFTTGRVYYAGQAVGLILADSFETAHNAAR